MFELGHSPKVQLVDVIKFDKNDSREDDEGRGDQQQDVTNVQKLLVLCCLSLHCRQSRLLRTRTKHRHDDRQLLSLVKKKTKKIYSKNFVGGEFYFLSGSVNFRFFMCSDASWENHANTHTFFHSLHIIFDSLSLSLSLSLSRQAHIL